MLRLFFVLLFFPLFLASQVEASTALPLPKNTKEKGLSLTITVDTYQETVADSELRGWIHQRPRLATVIGYTPEIENIRYCPTYSPACALSLPLSLSSHFKKTDKPIADREKIGLFIDDLGRKVDRDPENAKFQITDGRVSVFVPSQSGIQIKQEENREILASALEQNQLQGEVTLALSFEPLEPQVKTGDENNLGIETLIGEGTSNFRGSPKNRIFNITVATDRFNGILIPPGEEFSFVKILGPVDGEHGYLPELVIKKDKTEPEFGGGICQVSTTTFRAAINSGLKITARRNHAYPVAYYNPQGMDATVYVPRPDLRFVNNTPGHILIQTKIEGTILSFKFYGTADGRTIEINGPKIIQRNPDGSMKTTFSQKVYDQDKNLIVDDIFNSSYDSPAKYPHPGQESSLTQKPSGWSDSEWKKYKKANGL